MQESTQSIRLPPNNRVIRIFGDIFFLHVLDHIIHVHDTFIRLRPNPIHRFGNSLIRVFKIRGRINTRHTIIRIVKQLSHLINKTVTHRFPVQACLCHRGINAIHGIPIPLHVLELFALFNRTLRLYIQKTIAPTQTYQHAKPEQQLRLYIFSSHNFRFNSFF